MLPISNPQAAPLMRRVMTTLLCTATLVTACGDRPASPSQMLDLSGTWRGTVGIDMASAQMTWTLTQTNAAITGPATVALPNGIVLMNGTVAGTLSNVVLTYTLNVPPGGVTLIPSCSGQVAGTMTATSPHVLNGTYQLVTSSCATGLTNGTLTMNRL